jgi:hypothetical protein
VEITFVGARPAQIRLHPTVMVDLVQPNLLDPSGDGALVIKRIRMASEELGEPRCGLQQGIPNHLRWA